MQIGDVAERTALSPRTIRHYEEVGLLPEAERSAGGFRLYSEDAVARLLLITRMNPRLSARTRAGLRKRLAGYHTLVEHTLKGLREQVDSAQAFSDQLTAELT